MSDEETRVMPVPGIADDATEALPVISDPGEERTEAFQMPFDDDVESQRAFGPVNTSEPQDEHEVDERPESAGRTARDMPPAHPTESVASSERVRIGTTSGDAVMRPSGPSVGTIVLGVFFCLVGLMAMLCLLPTGIWRWVPNPSTLFFYVVGGLGALLLIISAIWAVASAVRLRRQERQSAEQSPERQ